MLKDFIGKTIVLDESEFKETEGYNQQSLFEDVSKDIYSGYADRFEEYKSQIIDTVSADKLVDRTMNSYGYYISQLRQMRIPMHLLFHINRSSFISFTGGTLMKNPIFILTEQRQSNVEEYTSTIIQQAITAWLTKELRK